MHGEICRIRHDTCNMAERTSASTPKPVTVTLEALRNGDFPCATENPTTLRHIKLTSTGTVPFSTLEQAFGPTSLGILLVSNLPDHFHTDRSDVLSHASYLAALPPSELEKLECPEASYLVGWSRGRESLASGQYDTLKGSYYFNCGAHHPSDDSSAHGDLPEYTHPNLYPPATLLPLFPEIATTLTTFIVSVAVLVAAACDRYGVASIPDYIPGTLQRIVSTSTSTKARLLHYYPSPTSSPSPPAAFTSNIPAQQTHSPTTTWCAPHRDHGCLTGLTSAMYVDETALSLPQALLRPPLPPSHQHRINPLPPLPELPSPPDPRVGLYVRARSGQTVQVSIPRDCLAFQTGEALEILTKGRFKAVWHEVRGGATEAGRGVARNTLAVFTREFLPLEVLSDKGDLQWLRVEEWMDG